MLLPELLDLPALALKLLLLLCELAPGLLVPDHLILQLIANYGAASRAQTASNSCTRGGMAHGGADYRARAGASAPTPVPFSRSVSGCPLHAVSSIMAASANAPVTIFELRIHDTSFPISGLHHLAQLFRT